MPKTMLVKNADVLVTMDAARREILCAPAGVVIDGKIVVKEARLTTVDVPVLIAARNRLARALVQ